MFKKTDNKITKDTITALNIENILGVKPLRETQWNSKWYSSDTYIMRETVHHWLSAYVMSFLHYFCGHT